MRERNPLKGRQIGRHGGITSCRKGKTKRVSRQADPAEERRQRNKASGMLAIWQEKL